MVVGQPRHDQHVGTVWAEISRLLRALGALVAMHPYRLATGVLFDVLRDAG